MTSAERRAEIMRILTVRRSETASRLASELEVSPSTIYRDVLALTAEYPSGATAAASRWRTGITPTEASSVSNSSRFFVT